MTDQRSTGDGGLVHAEQDVPDPSAAPDLDRGAVPRQLTDAEIADARIRADHEATKWGYGVWVRVLDALDAKDAEIAALRSLLHEWLSVELPGAEHRRIERRHGELQARTIVAVDGRVGDGKGR